MCCGAALKKTKSIAQGITYAIQGKNEELYKHRLKICKTAGPDGGNCKAFTPLVELCQRCGCPISTKGRVHKETCPLKKW